jgi:hypothetical protein
MNEEVTKALQYMVFAMINDNSGEISGTMEIRDVKMKYRFILEEGET